MKKLSKGKGSKRMSGRAKRIWNDKGIRRAARLLGVSHSHLLRVMSGERTSLRLTVRYQALVDADGLPCRSRERKA